MKQYITYILFGFILFGCKTDKKQPNQKEKLINIGTTNINQYSKYHYVVENSVALYEDTDMNYKSKVVDILDFLEPVEILKEHKDLIQTITYGSQKEITGYICSIKTLDGEKGFIFSEHLKTYDELEKRFDMRNLNEDSIEKNGRISKAEGMLRFFDSFDNKPYKRYSYTIANRLSLRETPSLDAKRITVLKYLEPLEIIENLPNKKDSIEDQEDGIINGNWCKVRLLNGIEGYAFNGYIKEFGELSEKLNPKGIESDELLINGKLKTTTTLKRFLEVMEKPDSIRSYKVVKDDFSGKTNREFKNGILNVVQNTPYNYLEYGDGGWVYDDVRMKYYYKNGIEYEELNGEVGFSSVDFTQNNNYLIYNGFKIDSSTTLQTVVRLFPVQSINKPRKYDVDAGEVFEFGTVRAKNQGTEIYWQLDCSKKVKSFNVYWYD